jgi:hypothetical protein
MKTTHRFMGLFGCLACLGMGGSVYADTGDSRSVFFHNLAQGPITVQPPEKIEGTVSTGIEIRDGMMFVPPRPDINYKIGKVTPEKGVDYKIQILVPSLRSRLEDIIRKDVPRE